MSEEKKRICEKISVLRREGKTGNRPRARLTEWSAPPTGRHGKYRHVSKKSKRSKRR